MPAAAPTAPSPLSLHDALPIFSVRELPVPIPFAAMNVYAIAPPISSASTRVTSCSITLILSLTFAPPRMARYGLRGGAKVSDKIDRKSTRLNSSHVRTTYAGCRAHRALPSFPTRRSSDLLRPRAARPDSLRGHERVRHRAADQQRVDARDELFDHLDLVAHLRAAEDGQVRLARRREGERQDRSEEHTSELQSRPHHVCRLPRPPRPPLFPYTTLFRSSPSASCPSRFPSRP